MSADFIESTFVQREPLAERLVDIFEESALRRSKHNVVLIGPRGIGKSHLVSLVYHRLKAKTYLHGKLSIAYLKEDEWGVNSFLDLLRRIWRVVNDEEQTNAKENADSLSRFSEEQAEGHVWNHLKEGLSDKTLLVIVENLDSIFRKIGEQGQQKWRALIQTYPQWTILATTPALFSGISRQLSPFYGFFEVIHLQPLSLVEAISLLKKLAALNHDQRTIEFLDTPIGRARVRAVQHLAGGNHRIFVLFYDFLNQSGVEHFVAPLLKTIDALTPYYQAQMDKLSPQQQKIVNFLCEYRSPATVTMIATSCFTTHQTAASQLKQLLNNRYVRVDRVGRESFYELTEPLLRICVEAKTHHDRPLNLLVDFVRYWFSREELEKKLDSVNESDSGKPYILAALREYEAHNTHKHVTSEIADLCAALGYGKDSPDKLKSIAQELTELAKIAEDWSHYTRGLAWLGRGAEAIPILEEQFEKDFHNIELLRCLGNAYASAGLMDRARDYIERAIGIGPNIGVLFFDKGNLLFRSSEYKEALEAFEQAAFLDSNLRLRAKIEQARTLIRLQDPIAAQEILRPYLAMGETVPGIIFLYGIALANAGDHEGGLEYFDRAARLFENDVLAWGNKGIALCTLGRYEEAAEALSKVFLLNPQNKNFSHHYCEALFKTGRYDLAIQTASPEVLSHNVFHAILEICNLHPKQWKLGHLLDELMKANDSLNWRKACIGGMTEFAGYAAEKFVTGEALESLRIWNSVLQELLGQDSDFSILLKLFDVLARVRVENDRKALLELPREQRLLIIGSKNEEDFLNDR